MNPLEIDLPEPDAGALIACGDWACAHCNPEALAEVAARLAALIDGTEARELHEIERLSEQDMLIASTLWQSVTRRLRERVYGHEWEGVRRPH